MSCILLLKAPTDDTHRYMSVAYVELLPFITSTTHRGNSRYQVPAPPAGFDRRDDKSTRGKLTTIEYDSATVGIKTPSPSLHPSWIFTRSKISRALSAAWHRRQ